MTPIEPPAEPSGGTPRPSDPSIAGPGAGPSSASGAAPSSTTVTGSITQPIGAVARARAQTWFGEAGTLSRFVARWGFPLFVVLILILGREVLLPFVFAGLIAYILTPVVRWMVDRRDGTRRMPRVLAILACYLMFISLVAGFLFLLVPRLLSDVARLGKEAPGLLDRVNQEWTPEAARWLEGRVPSLTKSKPAVVDPVVVDPAAQPDSTLPPGTAFTIKPLPEGGGYSLQLTQRGVDIKVQPDGSYHLQTEETRPEPASLEVRLRSFVSKTLAGLQSKLNDAVRLGQSLIVGFIRGIFLFFFTLMIGAFILIDLEKVHGFLRNLFPANVRDEYDVIIAGIDRGLSGVIRGQLVICVINSVLTYIGLLVFGVKYGLILAVVAGLMSLVPIFGSFLSSVPIVMVALVSGDQGIDVFRGVAMTLWIIGIHFIEANLLNPKIIGTTAKIHPVLVIFSLFLGEHAYGLVGALLAVPVLSAISVVFMYLYRKTWKEAPRAPSRSPTGTTAPIPRPPEAAAVGTSGPIAKPPEATQVAAPPT